MTKTITISLAVLLLSVGLFAVTPSGTVSLAYAPQNSDGTCPATGSTFGSITLDGSGNGTLNNISGGLTSHEGTFCILAHYSGDAGSKPSDATPFIETIAAPVLQNTHTVITCAPSQTAPGGTISCNVAVSAP